MSRKEEKMSNVQALKAHLALNVRNVEQSIEFYKKMLGIEPSIQNRICEVRRAEPAFESDVE